MKLAQRVLTLVKEKPEFGRLLIPMVKKAYFDPEEISKIEPTGPLVRDPEDTYLEDQWSEQETSELSNRQERGDLSSGKGNPEPMKFANDETALYQATVKLAFDRKELRPLLLPLLKEAKKAEEEEEEEDKEAGFFQTQMNTVKNKNKKKKAGDQDLYEATVKLAYAQPSLRPHLLPLIKEAGKIPPQFLENIKKKKDEAKEKDGDKEEKEEKKASELYKATVKLAYDNPKLRPHLLPLLKGQ